jgi:hypothetical protein
MEDLILVPQVRVVEVKLGCGWGAGAEVLGAVAGAGAFWLGPSLSLSVSGPGVRLKLLPSSEFESSLGRFK